VEAIEFALCFLGQGPREPESLSLLAAKRQRRDASMDDRRRFSSGCSVSFSIPFSGPTAGRAHGRSEEITRSTPPYGAADDELFEIISDGRGGVSRRESPRSKGVG
jgi:hypothetical protein